LLHALRFICEHSLNSRLEQITGLVQLEQRTNPAKIHLVGLIMKITLFIVKGVAVFGSNAPPPVSRVFTVLMIHTKLE
jgi:hypothetical protein